jgi:steroid 5-alpha reductase family enzyme
MNSLVIIVALVLLVYMTLWWLVALYLKRNDVADIAWGLGFVFMSWLAFAYSGYSARSLLMCCLVTIWGLRLAWHIARRNLGKPEDARYAAWRQEWKHVALRSYLQIFLLQGVLLFVILFPVLLVHASATVPLQLFDVVGVGMWLLGFACEAVSDAQLKNFLSDPANRGHIMDRGLWAYSRHPNYFGEVVQWWGMYLLAVAVPFGLATVVSPLLITFLILFVSGVPLLEKKYAGRPDFEAYKKHTSMFVPWFRKAG